MAYDKAVDSTVLEDGLTQIADAIREKGGLGDLFSAPLTFPSGFASAVAALSAGGLNAAAGSFTPASNTQAYFVNHALGEVPVLFAVCMEPHTTVLAPRYCGGFGFGEIAAQSHIVVETRLASEKALSALYGIQEDNGGLLMSGADEQTVCLCAAGAGYQLVGGATYDWIAVGSGVLDA